MTIEEIMRDRLSEALSPTRLEVINESHKHAGHMGDDGSGESHWHLVIASPVFAGKTRVAQHRLVHGALGDVMERIHALSMELSV